MKQADLNNIKIISRKLDEACDIIFGTRVVQKKDGGDIYPVYGGGGATFKMDTYNRENCLVVSRFAMSKQCTRFVEGKFYLNDSGLTIKPKNKEELTQEYLDYLILTLNDTIYSLSRGTAQRNLNVTKFRTLEIKYPESIKAQLHIASLLSKAERLISQRKESIRMLDEFLKSTFLEMFGDPVRNEKGWERVITNRILEVRGRVGWKGYKKSDLRQSGPYVLGATHLTSLGDIDLSDPVYISEEKFVESPEIVVQMGDLLIVQRGNTVGKVGLISKEIGEATINPCILILRPVRVNHFYLKYYFLQDKMQSQLWRMNTGSAQPMITQGQLRGMEMSFPPLELQTQFAQIVEKTEALKSQYRQSLQELENLYGSLSQRAFRGEVGVSSYK